MGVPGETAVSDIQSCIANRIGPHRYKIWFRNATRLTLANGYLKVGVPNLFVGGWIEDHFTDVISDAAREVTGGDVNVTVSIDPELAGAIHKTQTNLQAKDIARNPERQVRERRREAATKAVRPERPLRGRFDEFVVGPSNRLAYAAAVDVADEPGKRYNPLFIHGACGLGKTHLLQALCNVLKRQPSNPTWEYVSGEEFTNRYIFAMRMRALDAFRDRLRNLDVLVIDDIHFLANKKATQEEFLHTFNAISEYGKQIVMASDAHPKLIGQLSEKLVTRFLSGMVVRIDPPDFEMRCEILRRRAAHMEQDVPAAVVAYIAEHLEGHVRELEGALIKLAAYSLVTDGPLTVETARQALEDHLLRTAPIIRVSDIESTVATYFGLTPADLHTSRKTRTIALARGISMYLARKHTRMSFPEIGRFMGNKNHSTVILACRKIQRLVDTDGSVSWVSAAGKDDLRVQTLLGMLEEQLGKTARPAPP